MNKLTFSAAYTQWYRKMFNIAFSYIKNEEEARDIVASVFTYAFEKKNTINPATFENFLCVSVKNKCVDILRRKRFQKTIYISHFSEDFLTYDENFSSFDEKLISYNLHEAIKQLPPIQQKLIKLKYLEEMDRKTMASMCNSNEFTVRNNLALALKNLRNKMINKEHATN